MRISFFIVLILLSNALFALENWFTGPVIAFSAEAVGEGVVSLQSYLYYNQSWGKYSSHWGASHHSYFLSINPSEILWFGVSEKLQFNLQLQAQINHTRSRSFADIGDTIAGFGYELYRGDLWPTVMFTIQEYFPSGKYQHLNPLGYLVDSTGLGAFATSPSLYFQKSFSIDDRTLNLFCNLIYFAFYRTSVEGFNTYGGGSDTSGKVRVGDQFFVIFSGEYQITQEIVFSWDTVYEYENASIFSGESTTLVGLPSSEQFSLCPAIEYNWNEHMGVIAGVWFSFAGRNSLIFCAPVIEASLTF